MKNLALTQNITTRDLYAKYPLIVKWNYSLGSFDYFIEQKVWEAHNENAPVDSYSKDRETHQWEKPNDYILQIINKVELPNRLK